MMTYRSFRLGPICGARSRGRFWFRVFGYGLSVENRDVVVAGFAEREGFDPPAIRIFSIVVRWLR